MPVVDVVALALVLASNSPAQAQERTMMPVTIDGEQVKIATITYRPTGTGPFPTLIFHHGSTGSGTDPSRFSLRFIWPYPPTGSWPVDGRSFSPHGVGVAAPRDFMTKDFASSVPPDTPATRS